MQAETSRRPRRGLAITVAFVVGLAITIGVGLALVSARNKPDDPTWTFIGEERDCDQLYADVMASEVMFEAWQEQCDLAFEG